MFSQLASLAAKPKPKIVPKQNPTPTTTTTTVGVVDSAQQSLPVRRERIEEEEKQDDLDETPEIFESASPFQNKYANMTPNQERLFVQELRSKISNLESLLLEKIANISAPYDAKDENQEQTKIGNGETAKPVKNKTTPESRRKDDIVLTWVNLELSRWHFDLIAKKRQTDPIDVEGLDKCVEVWRKFVDNTLTEIQPLIDGLEGNLLPLELTDALFNAFNACHVNHKFNEAENIYFQYLLGNSNWHLGVFTMLHQRAAHDAFLRGNIKSKLHNHELRKMMVVFKELMNREQNRFEEEAKKKK